MGETVMRMHILALVLFPNNETVLSIWDAPRVPLLGHGTGLKETRYALLY